MTGSAPTITLASAPLRVISPIARCAATHFNPATAKHGLHRSVGHSARDQDIDGDAGAVEIATGEISLGLATPDSLPSGAALS